jgi:hypothetical protein
MSNRAYVGTAKRTFQQALIHLLETDYGLLGSQRILQLLAKDVQELIDQFYPAPDRLSSGWMVFTGTKASGPKAHPGQSAADHELVTLAWPVLLPEDLQQLSEGPAEKQFRLEWFQKRLVRIIEYGLNHPEGPVLLTQADLSAMTGLDIVQISKLLEEARQSTGKDLLTKGYFFDQGMRPTHKEAVIELYEQGFDEIDIARRTQHAQSSVGRYIRDYERVKLLSKRLIHPEQISRLLDMQPSVVQAYLSFSKKYHPILD